MIDAQPTPSTSYAPAVRSSRGTALELSLLDLIEHRQDTLTLRGMLEWHVTLMQNHASGVSVLSDVASDYTLVYLNEEETD